MLIYFFSSYFCYFQVAQYPAIPRFRNEDEKMEAEHAEKVKGMRTVEEKQYYVNLPKYFGWKAYVMDTAKVPPAALPSVQFTTNTTTVDGLPSPYNDLKVRNFNPTLQKKHGVLGMVRTWFPV